jgi:hypothetical protein
LNVAIFRDVPISQDLGQASSSEDNWKICVPLQASTPGKVQQGRTADPSNTTAFRAKGGDGGPRKPPIYGRECHPTDSELARDA